LYRRNPLRCPYLCPQDCQEIEFLVALAPLVPKPLQGRVLALEQLVQVLEREQVLAQAQVLARLLLLELALRVQVQPEQVLAQAQVQLVQALALGQPELALAQLARAQVQEQLFLVVQLAQARVLAAVQVV